MSDLNHGMGLKDNFFFFFFPLLGDTPIERGYSEGARRPNLLLCVDAGKHALES